MSSIIIMREVLTNIINKWDPIGLYSIAPEDEYSREIEDIETFLLKNNNVNTNTLGLEIYNVFINSFNQKIFIYSKDDCVSIANDILDLLNQKTVNQK